MIEKVSLRDYATWTKVTRFEVLGSFAIFKNGLVMYLVYKLKHAVRLKIHGNALVLNPEVFKLYTCGKVTSFNIKPLIYRMVEAI